MTVQSLSSFMQTLYGGAIESTTAYYWPVVILGNPLPLDPLNAGSVDFGDLSAISAALPTALCNVLNSGSIETPATSATLQLTNVQFIGLSNALPTEPSVSSGGTVLTTLNFGAVTATPPGVQVPSTTEITASFSINLSCCPSSNGTSCSGSSASSPIGGSVTVTFTGASLAVGFNVAPLDSGNLESDSAVTLTALTFAATGVTASFDVASPFILKGPLNAALNAAFNTAAGSAAILSAINGRLGSSAFLSALDTPLSTAFASLADPPILAFLLSLLYRAQLNPNSSAYLPKAVANASNPKLDPYSVNGTWDLKNPDDLYAGAGGAICAGVGPPDETYIETPNTAGDLSLSSISVVGMSNILPCPPLTIDDDVYGLAVFGVVSEWSTQLSLTGDFVMSVYCCQTVDSLTCVAGTSSLNTGSGTFSATISVATVSARVAISSSGGRLVATVERLNFAAPLAIPDGPGKTKPNVVWTIKITSVPNQAVWDAEANNIFNTPTATSAVIDQLQNQMNGTGVLSQLSGIITTALQSLPVGDQEKAVAALEARKDATGRRRSGRSSTLTSMRNGR